MNTLSIEILSKLTTYSDSALKILIGRLTLNMYGSDVSEECAEFVISEHDRRQAIKII